MITQIDHIGIAVSSLEEHIPFYRDVLGLKWAGSEEIADQKVKVAMFRAGEVNIELLEPLSEDSPIAKFIEKRGEGIHHIAYRTDNIITEIGGLKNQEVQMIDEKARGGAHGAQIAFIHPRSSGKVLTEICQKPEEHV